MIQCFQIEYKCFSDKDMLKGDDCMKLAILGYGTIGAGVYDLAKQAGLEPTRVLDLRSVPEGTQTSLQEILTDPEIEAVVETMGGLHPAFEYALAALEAGKHLVTANKLLVSEYGDRLAQAAKEHRVSFRFSAACGGGIPFLPALQDAARFDRIVRAGGILNGTTNFMLDRMERFAESYEDALSRAQALGYAERDPSADVDGLDTMRKCKLISALAFGVLPEGIPTAGIRSLRASDVSWYRGRKRVCRLTACCDGRAAWVEPTLLPESALEASIRENVNLAWYEGEATGRFAFSGQGAGRYPTAGNVLRDLMHLDEGSMLGEVRREQADCGALTRRYYVRMDGECPFPAQRVGENAWLTEAVAVSAMHQTMKEIPGAFFAAWLEE